tara:strand:- start:800 stop:991 length:192 start_codon:yes stop_codon:yes gene_type:complete
MDSLPPKPIEKVSNDLRVINRTLNEVKTDLMCIKSETQQIKNILKEISDKIEVKEEITKGWWY